MPRSSTSLQHINQPLPADGGRVAVRGETTSSHHADENNDETRQDIYDVQPAGFSLQGKQPDGDQTCASTRAERKDAVIDKVNVPPHDIRCRCRADLLPRIVSGITPLEFNGVMRKSTPVAAAQSRGTARPPHTTWHTEGSK